MFFKDDLENNLFFCMNIRDINTFLEIVLVSVFTVGEIEARYCEKVPEKSARKCEINTIDFFSVF